MKLLKIGKIFDPTDFVLGNHCSEFAQSPQALVFDNFVRIYFSTRAVDPVNSKYLSHIAYVDMTKTLDRVIGVSENTVIKLGGLGCFDEHGIFPMNVVRAGSKLLGYTCGWSRRVSVSVETSIGIAESVDDGSTFQRLGEGPILSSSLEEPFLVGDPFVMHSGGGYHMWYIFGTKWSLGVQGKEAERTYKIGHAFSRDGLDWKKGDGQQIVEDRLGDEESQALPTVVNDNGTYHMIFCYRYSSDFRHNPARGYRLGHARSKDLVNWTRADEDLALDISSGDWDSDMQCYPHLFRCDDKVYLLYNGNEFGRWGFGAAAIETW